MQVAALCLLLLLCACDFNCPHYGNEPPPPSPPGVPYVPPPVGTAYTFTQVSATILVPMCVSCHGKAGGVTLDSYANVMKVVKAGDPDESYLCYEVRNALMPPSGPALSKDQVDLVCGWIAQGAKP